MAGKTVAGQTNKAKKPTIKAARRVGPQDGRTSPRESRLVLVRKLIEKLGNDLEAKVTKTGVAELVRLLALEKELGGGQDTVREIKVTWIEPIATESSKSE